MTRKETKKAARGVLRRHYVLFVAVCLLGALTGREFALSASLLQAARAGQPPTVQTAILPAGADCVRTLVWMARDSDGACRALLEREQELARRESGVLARSRGLLAGALNLLDSGAYLAVCFTALRSVLPSEGAALALLVVLSAAVLFLLWFFIQNVYQAAARRVFLEGRVYPRVSARRLFFFRPGRWGRVAGTLFMKSLFQLLWNLTVVGGVVKHCAYFPVAYLVAENPELDWRRAMALSQRMMAGHKRELFSLELTFLGWRLLSLVTFGASGVFYSRPYRLAALSEYYAQLRAGWLSAHPEDAQALDDPYLFQAASDETLRPAYADCLARWDSLSIPALTGASGVLARNFGLLVKTGPRELAYAQAIQRRSQLKPWRDEAVGARYPSRLSPRTPPSSRRARTVGWSGRCYSVWSVVALFFLFSALGWLWEVGYAFLDTGGFVNRGVLHGPWLPIYGVGGCLVLLALYRFRDRPGRELLLAMALCGALECCTGRYLELVTGGQRWWDYSGYFLNLKGQVCAEGLLAFGLVSCAAVYLLAPWVDERLRKIPRQTLVAVCLVLLLLFAADWLWSVASPNRGPGITDLAAAAWPGRWAGPVQF